MCYLPQMALYVLLLYIAFARATFWVAPFICRPCNALEGSEPLFCWIIYLTFKLFYLVLLGDHPIYHEVSWIQGSPAKWACVPSFQPYSQAVLMKAVPTPCCGPISRIVTQANGAGILFLFFFLVMFLTNIVIRCTVPYAQLLHQLTEDNYEAHNNGMGEHFP